MKNDNDQGGEPAEVPAGTERHATSEKDQGKARKWFTHGKQVAETKNYDYAVELYVNGLALWPDAIEEGLRLLRVVAEARRLNGGKPAGFLDAKKHSTGGKNAAKALNNALYLFGKDPRSIGHMEHILQSAAKAKCDRTVQWIAPVLVEAMVGEKKLSEKRYADACLAMEAAADVADRSRGYDIATDILQACVRASEIWSGHYATSSEAEAAYRSASSKQTMVKGRFGSGEDFRESLKDGDEQRDIQDTDKMVRSADRHAELIAKARREWQENPEVATKLVGLADLLARSETDEAENEAIDLLEKEHRTTESYHLKVKADDIRIRQMNRHGRLLIAKLRADPKNPQVRKVVKVHRARQNKKEIAIFRDRIEHYPTDMKPRFNLGKRLFKAGAFDEAIPLLQKAQSDGRHRDESRLLLGRCFIEKGFHAQAVETLTEALEAVDSSTSEIVKDLNYWLARSQEVDGRIEDARKTYGHLIQLDYNYRDGRARLEALSPSKAG